MVKATYDFMGEMVLLYSCIFHIPTMQNKTKHKKNPKRKNQENKTKQ